MSKRVSFAILLAAALASIVLAGALRAGTRERARTGERTAERDKGGEREGERERGARFEVKDPDKDAKPGTITPAKEAFINRAFPRKYIPAAAVTRATRATRSLPTKLDSSNFDPGTPNADQRLGVGADWTFLGPTPAFAPAPTTESLKDSIPSGRVTALAIDPNCGKAGQGCRLWVAAAGGGIWRRSDAKADKP